MVHGVCRDAKDHYQVPWTEQCQGFLGHVDQLGIGWHKRVVYRVAMGLLSNLGCVPNMGSAEGYMCAYIASKKTLVASAELKERA